MEEQGKIHDQVDVTTTLGSFLMVRAKWGIRISSLYSPLLSC
jgi:hypothetical protein